MEDDELRSLLDEVEVKLVMEGGFTVDVVFNSFLNIEIKFFFSSTNSHHHSC